MAYNNSFKADGVNALVEEAWENNLERHLHCVYGRTCLLERADCKEAIPLIEDLPCKVLLADRGYGTDEIVEYAKTSGIQPAIPSKKNRKVQRNYDENLYKNVISLKTLSFG